MQSSVVIKRFNDAYSGLETVAYLENAYSVSYSLPVDGLYTCSFQLPGDDPKAECLTETCLIEIWDNGERVELFKVDTILNESTKEGYTVTVNGTHVRKFLQEKALFSVHEFNGMTIGNVIRELLSTPGEDGQPKQKHWALSKDFNEQIRDLIIDYHFENTTIDAALWSLTEKWETPTQWVYDTSVYPFLINLVAATDKTTCVIQRGKNLQSISVSKPIESVANRFYALGSGEGINQTNIMNAEDLEADASGNVINGHYYVEDEKSIEKYGLIEDYYTDRSVSEASLLLMGAKKMLSDYKEAKPIIQVEAVDLYPNTKLPQDHFVTGTGCHIIDPETGVDAVYRILNVSKSDVTGKPYEISLTLGDMPNTLSGTLDRLYSRDNSDKVNAQGATNVWSRPFADNADAEHPIKVTFRLPDDLLYVNKLILDISVENFRAYETGQAGGGGATKTSEAVITIGQSTRTSSSSGGATTVSASGSSETSEALSATYTYPEGEEYTVKTHTLWSYHNDDWRKRDNEPVATHSDVPGEVLSPGYILPADISHAIGVPAVSVDPINVTMYQHEHPHTHKVTIPSHSHSIQDHTHNISHTHTVAGHSHEIPNHTHDIEYGIYEEPTLAISAVKVQFDTNEVTVGSGLEYDGIDILKAIDQNPNEKISRGKHTLTITPITNDGGKGLCRITGELFIQCFVQSRGSYTV